MKDERLLEKATIEDQFRIETYGDGWVEFIHSCEQISSDTEASHNVIHSTYILNVYDEEQRETVSNIVKVLQNQLRLTQDNNTATHSE